jgi:hypothetical protein
VQLLNHSDDLFARCHRYPHWAAISRTLVEGTLLKMFRYQCTTHLCQATPGKNSAALSASPRQASEMMRRTPARVPRRQGGLERLSQALEGRRHFRGAVEHARIAVHGSRWD